MGQVVSLLFIGKKYGKPFTELTLEVGLGESEVIGRGMYDDKQVKPTLAYFDHACHPEICFGYYQDTTIVAYNEFMNDFFGEVPGKLEQAFCHLFTDCQMLSLIYHENNEIKGFSLFNNGERVRTKLVEDYEGTILDIGEKLEEERTNPFTTVWYKISERIVGKAFNYEEIKVKASELNLGRIAMTKLKLKT
jgi:hypothetical protein